MILVIASISLNLKIQCTIQFHFTVAKPKWVDLGQIVKLTIRCMVAILEYLICNVIFFFLGSQYCVLVTIVPLRIL